MRPPALARKASAPILCQGWALPGSVHVHSSLRQKDEVFDADQLREFWAAWGRRIRPRAQRGRREFDVAAAAASRQE
eukprot:624059-Pyramimonas_sp.AAC.1